MSGSVLLLVLYPSDHWMIQNNCPNMSAGISPDGSQRMKNQVKWSAKTAVPLTTTWGWIQKRDNLRRLPWTTSI